MSSGTEAAFADFAAHEAGDTIPFYKAEGQVLGLWDQLNELKLEQALLEAQITLTSGEQSGHTEVTNAQLKDAEKEYLEARAAYMLRQSVVGDVLMADPILKAVHSGEKATPTERALHPLIDRRDTLGIAHTNLCSSLQSVLRETASMEVDNIRTMEKNRATTAILLDLVQTFEKLQANAMKDPTLGAQLNRLKGDTATARKRWRMMKSVVGATIAGSGVDWARDDILRDLVLDEELEAD